jgi:hypothetical protein
MNLRTAVFVVLAAVCVALGFSGCGKGAVPIDVLPLTVTTTNAPTAVINKPYTATLALSGGLGPYSWNVISGTLPAGLALSASGVISGTATTTGTSNFTVQVTDSQTPTHAVASGAITLKVNNPLAISTTSIDIAAVNVPYQFTMTATGGASPYTWSLAAGALPAGLQLDPRFGVIFGTATVQGSFPITIQVADAENPVVTVQQAYTFTVGGPAARLHGSYTFLFRGFNNGKQVLQAGSFVSDGTGNITSGITDIVSTSASHASVPVTGTYTVDSTGHGTMNLTFGTIGTGSYQMTNALGGYWAFIQNGDGQATQYGTGTFSKQNKVPTDLANSKGNWVFGGYGADSADNRYAAGGTLNIQPGASGTGGATLQSGILDYNDHGSVSQNNAFTGTINQPDATTGRGTITLTQSGSSKLFAFYYIDDGDFTAIEIDPVTGSTPLIMYSMIQQTTFIPIDNTILNGNGVTELTAVAPGNIAETSLGLWSFDLKGTLWATFDDNTGGTLTQSKPQGTYSVTNTGRTTFTGVPFAPIFYIATTDKGFMLGTDANVTYGEMEQQRPPNQGNQSFVNGNEGGSILSPAVPSQTVEVDTFSADGGTPTGHLTGNYDTSGPNGPMMNLSINATYVVESNSCTSVGTTFNTCGRFPLLDANNNQIGIGYIVASLAPQRVVIMTTNSAPVINAVQQ